MVQYTWFYKLPVRSRFIIVSDLHYTGGIPIYIKCGENTYRREDDKGEYELSYDRPVVPIMSNKNGE